MSVPRVLLLAHIPPGSQGVGGIVLRDLCLSYPKESICCFSMSPLTLDWTLPTEEMEWLPIASPHPPLDYRFGRIGCYFPHLSGFLRRQYLKWIQIPALIKQVVQFGRQHCVEIVWAVLDDPILIRIIRRVVSESSTILVTTVWDPPECWPTEPGLDQVARYSLLQEFDEVVRSSVRCGVASEGMRDEYQKTVWSGVCDIEAWNSSEIKEVACERDDLSG